MKLKKINDGHRKGRDGCDVIINISKEINLDAIPFYLQRMMWNREGKTEMSKPLLNLLFWKEYSKWGQVFARVQR